MLPPIIQHDDPRPRLRIPSDDPPDGVVCGFLGRQPAAETLDGLVARQQAHHQVAVAGGAAGSGGGVDVGAAARDGAVADAAGDFVGCAVCGGACCHGAGGGEGEEGEGVVGEVVLGGFGNVNVLCERGAGGGVWAAGG